MQPPGINVLLEEMKRLESRSRLNIETDVFSPEQWCMPSPFPGMNPYLEHPARWQEFHDRLIVAIADELGPKLRPKYRAAVEERIYEDAGNDLTRCSSFWRWVSLGIQSVRTN